MKLSVCPNPNCRETVPQGEVFCPKCGWNLSAAGEPPATDDITCPKCGQRNPADAQFCENCGTSVATGTPARVGVLHFPDNSELEIYSGTQIFGRVELAKFVASTTESSWISRKHFFITNDGADFYIQDDNSLNKTSLNGEEITGKGRRLLHNGDQIGVAGAVMISFTIR